MLELSRKVDERIVLRGGVVRTVLALHRSQVRLGIEALPDVSVWREELVRTERREREPSSRERNRA
jgi:carbon storage regulator CsrA